MVEHNFSENEIKEIQKERHRWSTSYIEGLEVLEKKEEHNHAQIAGLVSKILTTVGIVAGFGFTVIENVTNRAFFILGEILLLTLLVTGLVAIYIFARSLRIRNEELGDYLISSYEDRLELYKQAILSEITKIDFINSLNEEDRKGLTIKPPRGKIQSLEGFIIFMLIFLILGIALLLVSF